jgi:hypothetical protein
MTCIFKYGSAHLDSQVCGWLVWHQSSIYYNPQHLIFQNTSTPQFTEFPSLRQQQMCKSSPISFLTSCIACYCTATAFQFRRLLTTKSAIFDLYTGWHGLWLERATSSRSSRYVQREGTASTPANNWGTKIGMTNLRPSDQGNWTFTLLLHFQCFPLLSAD